MHRGNSHGKVGLVSGRKAGSCKKKEFPSTRCCPFGIEPGEEVEKQESDPYYSNKGENA